MALNFNNGVNAARNAMNGSAPQAQDRPKTQYWLNVGFTSADGTFINLPVGIALDTMEKRQIRGNNPDWNALTQASNALLDMILEGAKSLGAGEATLAEGLQIQLKRVAEDAAEGDLEENQFLTGFGGISLGNKEVPQSMSEKRKARG